MTTHTSPNKVFTGTIELPDYLNILQVRAFQDAYFGDPNALPPETGKKVYRSVEDLKILPVLLDIVLKWEIKRMPEKPTLETFPMTPAADAHDFIAWVSGEVYKIFKGEAEIPNA